MFRLLTGVKHYLYKHGHCVIFTFIFFEVVCIYEFHEFLNMSFNFLIKNPNTLLIFIRYNKTWRFLSYLILNERKKYTVILYRYVRCIEQPSIIIMSMYSIYIAKYPHVIVCRRGRPPSQRADGIHAVSATSSRRNWFSQWFDRYI